MIIALILAYLFGIGEQQKYLCLYPDEGKKIDYLYPIATGIWLILHAIYGSLALVLEILSFNGNVIYERLFSPYARNLNAIANLAEQTLGCLVALLYYPLFFFMVIILKDSTSWILSFVAFAVLVMINIGYGYLAVRYGRRRTCLDNKSKNML